MPLIRYGSAPYLTCFKSTGLSLTPERAWVGRRQLSIESIYQSAKQFDPGGEDVDLFGFITPWKQARGRRARNETELAALCELLWIEYFTQEPYLRHRLCEASGLKGWTSSRETLCHVSLLWSLRHRFKQLNQYAIGKGPL